MSREPAGLVSSSLSHFKTTHRFLHFADFTTADEFAALVRWAKAHEARVYILGNGSNTWFARTTVRTVVLRNRLARAIVPLGNDRYELSSSCAVPAVLKYCHRRHLDCFYYLSSVPATIGGALAMNAGRGRAHHLTIYDFAESLRVLEDGVVHTLHRDAISLEYRHTPFTGLHDRLILSGVFRFPNTRLDSDPVRDRIDWSLREQDHTAPNCGSVFKTYHAPLQAKLRWLRYGGARWSPKTTNWILNTSRNSRAIGVLITVAQMLHRLLGKRAELELIKVK